VLALLAVAAAVALLAVAVVVALLAVAPAAVAQAAAAVLAVAALAVAVLAVAVLPVLLLAVAVLSVQSTLAAPPHRLLPRTSTRTRPPCLLGRLSRLAVAATRTRLVRPSVQEEAATATAWANAAQPSPRQARTAARAPLPRASARPDALLLLRALLLRRLPQALLLLRLRLRLRLALRLSPRPPRPPRQPAPTRSLALSRARAV
jgi:hypothetical protein